MLDKIYPEASFFIRSLLNVTIVDYVAKFIIIYLRKENEMKGYYFKEIIICLIIAVVALYAVQDYYAINPKKCKSCGTCFFTCTYDAIIRKGDPNTGKYTYTIDPALCQACGDCYNACKYNAIDAQTGTINTALTPSQSLGYIQSLTWDQLTKTVQIDYEIKKSSAVSIHVFNPQGKQVARLINNEFLKAGYHTCSWYSPFADGTYLFQISIDEKSEAKSLPLF